MNDLASSYESPWMNEELRILRDTNEIMKELIGRTL